MTTLREKVIAAIGTKDRDEYEKLAKQITKEVGTWDGQGRYTICHEFVTHTSSSIRKPSRAWPKSEYEHAQTRKYITALAEENHWLDRERLIERHQKIINDDKTALCEAAL